jgi:nucleoside-specific outer membrane channel protein Tsx
MNPYCVLGAGTVSNNWHPRGVTIPMKKLLLSLLALGAVLATTSVPVKADEDRGDHNWNDEYWHNNHEGYWHGHKGHWAYHHHKHTFIEAGPVTIETH